MAHEQRHPHEQWTHAQPASFYALFLVSFAIFAVVAVVGTACGCQWRTWLPGAEGVKSMTGGVKAAVYTFLSLIE
jgi:light-harvesting complex 1 beta chain